MNPAKSRGLKVTEDEASLLRIPRVSLPAYGYLSNQETSEVSLFDPGQITYKLQQTELGYFSDESLIDGSDFTYWLTVLKGRQAGSTTVCAMSVYPLTAYTPGYTAAMIADKKSRANEVFSRLNICHNRWPTQIRTERRHNETRSYTTDIDSKVIVESADTEGVGVGLSVDLLVGSELSLWPDAGAAMSGIMPAMVNRKKSKIVLESTAQPMTAASGQWWKDHYFDSVKGEGRWRAAFFPFWDSKLNSRPWPKGQKPTLEEIRLLERFGRHDTGGVDIYGHPGLTLDNLAFRREVFGNDAEIKRNPDLFNVWYPFDDQTCWVSHGLGVVPAHAIDPTLARQLHAEVSDYNEFPEFWAGGGPARYEVNPNAVYVMGIDPAGYGMDHQAFQVLEVWDDAWIQVASFGARMDPNSFMGFALEVAERFNMAKVVIERPGVGQGHAMLARHLKYPNLHYDEKGKPGLHKVNDEAWLAKLVDALIDGQLILRGADTARQVKDYNHDRVTEQSQRAVLLRGNDKDKRRRGRHHWDKVSALMVACVVAPRMPRRYRRVDADVVEAKSFDQMTVSEQDAYFEYVKRMTQPQKRRLHYRRR
jgi:hypothetical protein